MSEKMVTWDGLSELSQAIILSGLDGWRSVWTRFGDIPWEIHHLMWVNGLYADGLIERRTFNDEDQYQTSEAGRDLIPAPEHDTLAQLAAAEPPTVDRELTMPEAKIALLDVTLRQSETETKLLEIQAALPEIEASMKRGRERIEVLEAALMDFKAMIETLPTENIDARTSRLVTGALNAMYEHILDVMHARIVAQRVQVEEPPSIGDDETEKIIVLPYERLDYADDEELGR